jgi:hypothetical protein
VRDVNEPGIRSDSEDDALHHADVVIARSEVGE